MTKLVFIHGWGLNSGVWHSFSDHLRQRETSLEFEFIDLPGYGTSIDILGADSLEAMARHCLDRVREPAIWVGWSLGGMVAMKAASIEPSLIVGMQLISTSPKFVQSADWPEGVDMAIFESFSEQLANDYQRTLTMFLLLQAGSNTGARELARAAHQAICQLPSPSAETLHAGICCLEEVDLRAELGLLSMPIQVISGLRDRVAKPATATQLAKLLNAELIELNAGHASFMSGPDEVASNLLRLVEQVSSEH